jgi:hypothetical protein
MRLPLCSVRIAGGVLTSLVILLLAVPVPGGQGAAAPVPEEILKAKYASPDTEVRCTDGSVLKFKMLDDHLTLKTPYGKLLIPFAKINEIECANRTTDDIQKRIARAIADLGSSELRSRQAAEAELERLRMKAYPALVKAEKDPDLEVQRRAKRILEKLRGEVSEENLTVRERDVVHTEDAKFTGQIEPASFRIHTEQFGELRLNLYDVRSLRALGFVKEEPEKLGPALPNPGSLQIYQAQIGKVLLIEVTGALGGSVWGTDVYTLDSALATAAVHAGVVKVGKTGIVKVRILPARAAFVGSNRNGVDSQPYMNYPGAYEFVVKK